MTNNTINWPEGASVYKNGKFYTLSGKPVGSVAMDAAHEQVLQRVHFEPGQSVGTIYVDVDEATAAKMAKVKAKVAQDAEDNEIADAMVKMLMPTLRSIVANDGVEEEQAAQGSFSSEDDNELERGEVTGNDSTSFEQSVIASAAESRRYWDGVKQRNAERNKRYGNNVGYEHSKKTLGGKATDAVSRNAKASRSFSLFDNAATIIRKLKRA